MMTKQRIGQWLAAGTLSLIIGPLGLAAAAAFEIAPQFRDFYTKHQGIRVLGNPITFPLTVDGYQSQYFEKGRIEDHSRETTNPAWKFMYGRLTVEMIELHPFSPVNGTNVTYKDVEWVAGTQTHAAPEYKDGVQRQPDGSVFVPHDAQLKASAGNYVPAMFWNYINRQDLFPGGWLHDVGLPVADVMTVETVKNGERRTIQMQAFERTVLTYDPKNPAEWQVERGNIGTDMKSLPGGLK